jgi:hypothetical protein
MLANMVIVNTTTHIVNETHLFELTKRTTGLCENKKSGKLSQNEMNSALVDLRVLILNFVSV